MPYAISNAYLQMFLPPEVWIWVRSFLEEPGDDLCSGKLCTLNLQIDTDSTAAT